MEQAAQYSSRTWVGKQHLHLVETDSTNNRALEYIHQPDAHGLVISAETQTSGRGQYGRTWQDGTGQAVLLSVLLYPSQIIQRASIMTAYGAIAVAQTLEHFVNEKPLIKWPNDVLVNGKKVCGILLEGGTTPHQVPYVVIGIGLNVRQTQAYFDAAGLPQGGSLQTVTGKELKTSDVRDCLIDQLDRLYGELQARGPCVLEEKWVEYTQLSGRQVQVVLHRGDILVGILHQQQFGQIVVRHPTGMWHGAPEEIRNIFLIR
ncbi:MAG: biotin--[acetyl-CoA-carboxylase] ligase [Zavarzinella sp.]